VKITGREKILRKRERRVRSIYRDHYPAALPLAPDPMVYDESDNAINKSNDYHVTKIISKIISFTGWITLMVGFVIIGYGLIHSRGYENIDVTLVIVLPGIGMIFTGLFLIVAGQIARATVDNATHNKHILMELTRIRKRYVEAVRHKFKVRET